MDNSKGLDPILNASSCEQKFQLLMSELDGGIDTLLPQKTIKKHPNNRCGSVNANLHFLDTERTLMPIIT